MPTPHISANSTDFAKTVLMPGDPLRAKFIAENFLENPVCINNVRGMLGFTGKYKGKDVSVMGSGMGMPSIGIYSYELYTQYNVDNIIRVGSAGAYSEKLELFDMVLATAAYSESSYAQVQSGCFGKGESNGFSLIKPSEELTLKLENSAAGLGKKINKGVFHSSDVFYRSSNDEETPYWQILRDEKNCLCVEMEAFALFHNAKVCSKHAAAIVTISDSFVRSGITSSEEREQRFTDMMEIALGTL